MKRKILLQYILAGALAGYFVFHPLIMLLSYLMTSHITAAGAITVTLRSFSISMLPWSLSFALFNGVIGLYYGTIKVEKLAREELIMSLQKALSEVKTLSGMLPICSSCKKIRDDKGYWQQIEDYISSHSDLDFTHGICNDCVKKLYPEIYPQFKAKMHQEPGRNQ